MDADTARIERKLNALARVIGGPRLKSEWDAAEAADDIPTRRRTFRRRRCGCFVGSDHEPGCEREGAV